MTRVRPFTMPPSATPSPPRISMLAGIHTGTLQVSRAQSRVLQDPEQVSISRASTVLLCRYSGRVRRKITSVPVSPPSDCIVCALGTGIKLFGNATRSSYDITIDNEPTDTTSADLSNNTLLSIDNLPDSLHTLALTVQTDPPGSLFEFDKALISAPTSPSNVSKCASRCPPPARDPDFLGHQFNFYTTGIKRHRFRFPRTVVLS
jgi:hypothetical protein